jgi:hypothetical protein
MKSPRLGETEGFKDRRRWGVGGMPSIQPKIWFMLTAACLSLPPYSIAKDRHVLSTARRRDRPPRIAPLQSAFFQSAYDLSGAPEREGNRV